MAAAAREWGPELGVITCSMGVKQVLDNVSPKNLSLVMKGMDIAPVLLEAILREQIGVKYDICSQETRISGIPFDKSTKQGGKESPCWFPDDEERLQDIDRRMEGAADGCQDQASWCSTTGGRSESHDLCYQLLPGHGSAHHKGSGLYESYEISYAHG